MNEIRSRKLWIRLLLVFFLAASTVSVTHAVNHDHITDTDACIYCQLGKEGDNAAVAAVTSHQFLKASSTVFDSNIYEVLLTHSRFHQARAPPSSH